MRRLVTLTALVGALLPAAADGAQTLDDLTAPAFDPDAIDAALAPITLAFDTENSGFLPDGRQIELRFVLNIAPKHKVYPESVTITLPETPGVKVAAPFAPPTGVAETDYAGKTIMLLKGRNDLSLVLTVDAPVTKPLRLKPTVAFVGCSETLCFPREGHTFDIEVPLPGQAGGPRERSAARIEKGFGTPPPAPASDLATIARETRGEYDFSKVVSERGTVVALLIAFAWGLLVSLTPCVWPLIPIVVSVVGAGAEGTGWKRGLRLSLSYVLGMSVTYAALGGIVAAAAQTAQVDALRTNPWVIGAACVVFVALALSMFDLYEIRLPSALASKLQKKRGPGMLGVLLTGLVSGLVASPCVTAPALALFAGIALVGSVTFGIIAGAVFAFGMGAILIVAGTSSKAMQALPRSGGWMVGVKHFFGWVLIGVAIYFAHMFIGTVAYHVAMGAFLVIAGVFMGPFRAITPETTWTRKLLQAAGILVIVLGVVFFVRGVGPMFGLSAGNPPDGAAGGIRWVHDAADGLARAESEKKPVLIDGYTDWCTACKEMDATVLSRADVIAESARFVMIKVDLDRDPLSVDLKRTYGIAGAPAFVFIPTTGDAETINGAVDAGTFLTLMKATR